MIKKDKIKSRNCSYCKRRRCVCAKLGIKLNLVVEPALRIKNN